MKKLLLLLLLLSACGKPRPLTMEEQDAYMAQQQCQQEATDMNPVLPGPDNPDWNAYFVMCMQNMGIPDAVLYRMLE